jgi:hypothetical protein
VNAPEKKMPGPKKSMHTREQRRAHDRVVDARIAAILLRRARRSAA